MLEENFDKSLLGKSPLTRSLSHSYKRLFPRLNISLVSYIHSFLLNAVQKACIFVRTAHSSFASLLSNTLVGSVPHFIALISLLSKVHRRDFYTPSRNYKKARVYTLSSRPCRQYSTFVLFDS